MKQLTSWIIALLLALHALYQVAPSVWSAHQEDQRINAAISALPPSLASAGPPPGQIEVMQWGAAGELQMQNLLEVMHGHTVSELQMQDLLGIDSKRSTVFSLNLFGVEHATSTAMGIDKKHHFVNAYLEGYSPFKVNNAFIPLHVLAQRKTYMLDQLNNGSPEIWQSSKQAFYFPRGDCEDHAIALADWLIDMGEDARVVAGTYKGEGHAWVVLIKDGQSFILEATSKRGVSSLRHYPLAKTLPAYKPQFQFNRGTYWYYTSQLPSSDYNSSYWQQKSHFERTL